MFRLFRHLRPAVLLSVAMLLAVLAVAPNTWYYG
jgi:hypothetical protein